MPLKLDLVLNVQENDYDVKIEFINLNDELSLVLVKTLYYIFVCR